MYVSESGHSAKLSLDVAEFIRNTRSAKEATDGLTNATAQLTDKYPELQKVVDKAGRALVGQVGGTNAVKKSTDSATAATAAAAKASKSHTASLISARYALYDVSTTAGIASVALLGASALTVKVGADFESAFTGVERTSSGSIAEIEGLRDALVELSTQVPLTFQELSSIAALGNQLGVASQDIEGFTGTVARFSAVTGLTAEATAQAFGRISNILGTPIAEAENLGSAITLVGRNSASTEKEIIGLTERLGATATRAGFTADEVVGLAGALGSLGVAPERAQGVFETYFNTLNESVAEGGKKLEYFAQITGLSTDAVNEMVRSGDGFEVFQSFLSGLQGADTVELTTALGELGLTGLRANEVIGRISGSMPLLKSAFADASQGYSEGSELGRQYALIADDLNSKFKMLVNSVNALIAEMSGGSISGVAGLLTVLTDVVNKAREFADSTMAQNIVRFALVFGVVAGAVLGLVSMIALAAGSTFALRTAMSQLGQMGASSGIRGLIQAIFGVKVASDAATKSSYKLAGGLKAIGVATVVGAALQLLTSLIFDFEGTVKGAANIVLQFNNFLGELGTNMMKFEGLTKLVGESLGLMSKQNKVTLKDMQAWVNEAPKDALDDFSTSSYDAAAAMADAAFAAGGGVPEYEALGETVDDVAAKVVTLKDYASDLAGVIGRAFEIRFSGGQGSDAIATGWDAIAKATEDANKSIRDYQQTLRDLNADSQQLGADRKVLEYFKEVADRYGDGLASADLSARLAKNAAEQAKKQNELADANKGLTVAQDANSKVLTGNSTAAIANRAQILGLVTSYQDYIAKLAASGMSQDDLRATSERLKAEFLAQATQAGYSATEIDTYSAAFDDMTFAINNVPRNITVDANTDPAMQALAEFLAAAAASNANVAIGSSGAAAAGAAAGTEFGQEVKRSLDAVFADTVFGFKPGTAGQGLGMIRTNATDAEKYGWADGGYTGDGGMYQPAGVVHKGEYVFSKAATSSLGVNNLAKLHSMGKGSRGYANGGLVGGSAGSGSFGGPTDLSAGTIMAIAQAVSQINVNLYTTDRRLAESNNRGQMELASGGTN